MNPRHTKPIRSTAVGHRIESLSYNAETGYLVIELESNGRLWISADYEGYHIVQFPQRPLARIPSESLRPGVKLAKNHHLLSQNH